MLPQPDKLALVDVEMEVWLMLTVTEFPPLDVDSQEPKGLKKSRFLRPHSLEMKSDVPPPEGSQANMRVRNAEAPAFDWWQPASNPVTATFPTTAGPQTVRVL